MLRLSLPRRAQANMTDQPRPRRRILVVDDDRAHSEALARALRRQHEVVVTDGPAAALAVLERESFDIVISDYSMPGGDGIGLLGAIRERWPTVRRLLVSSGDVPPLEAAEASGLVEAYFAKPVFLGALTKEIERDLGGRLAQTG